jgi:hypothetical protein
VELTSTLPHVFIAWFLIIRNNFSFVRFQILTAYIMKTVFRYVASCNLAENDQSFIGVYSLHHQVDE